MIKESLTGKEVTKKEYVMMFTSKSIFIFSSEKVCMQTLNVTIFN